VAAGFPFISTGSDPIRTIGLGVSVINEIQAKAAEVMGYSRFGT